MTAHSDLKKRIRARQAKTGESYTAARMHVLRTPVRQADSDTSPLGTHQAVVLKCTARALRIRVRGEQEAVTLRCSSRTARTVAPAQHVQVTLTKRWSWGGDT
jgi:hypothetical protein